MAMKKSAARILIYLSQVYPHQRTVTLISHQLDIGYNYVSKLLSKMLFQKWLRKSRLQNKMFYSLTELGRSQLKEAKEVLK